MKEKLLSYAQSKLIRSAAGTVWNEDRDMTFSMILISPLTHGPMCSDSRRVMDHHARKAYIPVF